MFIFFVLMLLFISDNHHTDAYHMYSKNQLFDNQTFGIHIYNDPCTIIDYNVQFRNYVNQHLQCNKKWCVDHTYSCKYHLNDRLCYEVEHIIDKNGPELNTYCKNIAGNMVMALGKWNMELGRMTIDYNYYLSKREKEMVYGKDIMIDVRDIIINCNKQC